MSFSGLMNEWKSFDEPAEVKGYAHLPGRMPFEVLAFWIEPYRLLDVLITPMYTLWDQRYLTEVEPPSHCSQRERVIFHNTRELEIVLWKIKDMYLECGWNVASKEQNFFDRIEFIKLREEYMAHVIEPLERHHEETLRSLEEEMRQAGRNREEL